jgi:ribosome-associated toxin RatA of RatAB toxin-antitoxin module
LSERAAVEEQVAERIMVRASPEQCFEILTNFEDYPSWSPDIKEVTVLERDDRGRGTKVTIRAAAFGRSTSLTLAYDYSEAPARLSWVQESGDLTRCYDGVYSFEPAGDETEVTFPGS